MVLVEAVKSTGGMRRPPGLSLEDSFRWFMPGDPPEEGCWEWTGTRFSKTDYGWLKYQGRMRSAHRVAYEIFHGTIPDRQVVRHMPIVCDNPPCVHPVHLLIGTVQDNSDDMVLAGRQAVGGDRHGHSKLTPDAVREIRQLAVTGMSQRAIGERFEVSKYPIWEILQGRTWTHVT